MAREPINSSPKVSHNGTWPGINIQHDPLSKTTLSSTMSVGENSKRKLKKKNVSGDLTDPPKTTDGKGFKQAVTKTLSSPVLSAGLDMAAGLIPDSGKNTSFQQQQQLGSALSELNPIVGNIFKATSILGELTGTNVSRMSKDQAKAAGVSGAARTFNNIASFIPGIGFLGKTIDAEKSHLIDDLSGAYGGAVSDINTAGTMAGQNYLFGKGKANEFIATMNERNRIMTNISQTNTLRKSSDYGNDIAQQNLNRYAGTNYMNVHMGKNGMKFATLEEIRKILTNRKQTEAIEKFANGGLIEGENFMPQGQLHARLHHIDKTDAELAEKLTRKGIPVIALSENGDIEQVAEIEHSEWIMSKVLTDKIEELRQDGSEEAMIEAGKILVDELLFNTKDEGGVINE